MESFVNCCCLLDTEGIDWLKKLFSSSLLDADDNNASLFEELSKDAFKKVVNRSESEDVFWLGISLVGVSEKMNSKQ